MTRIEQKQPIDVKFDSGFNDVMIHQGSNWIYLEKSSIPQLIEALKKEMEK